MTTADKINLSIKDLADFCLKWKISEISLFGSALTDRFTRESDLDFLVTFAPDANWGLLEHQRMQAELAHLSGRNIDIVSRKAVERSANWIRRKSILDSAVPLYAG